MHVDDVGADRHVNRDRDGETGGRSENAGVRERWMRRCQESTHRLSKTETIGDPSCNGVVQQPPGLLRHAETPGAKCGVDVLRRSPD